MRLTFMASIRWDIIMCPDQFGKIYLIAFRKYGMIPKTGLTQKIIQNITESHIMELNARIMRRQLGINLKIS